MGAWLICSTIRVIGLAYGQLALSAYFLALSCRHAALRRQGASAAALVA
ncbi:MAG: hypothetical protein ACYDC9_13880 [Dermatophilaceae bacterium]